MSETSASAKDCRTCTNLRREEGRVFCTWLGSFLERKALGGFCEGYAPARESVQQKCGKDKSVGNGEVSRAPRLRSEKGVIFRALELKNLKGSIVWQKVPCGKNNCRCSRGDWHGPYAYLRFWQNGKGRKKYLGKGLAVLVSKTREELEAQLEEILGQENRSNETSGAVTGCIT